MTPNSESSTALVFRFADYELNPSTSELRKAGRRIKLAPQPSRVLSLLVSRAGELVTRAEIRRAIWGDGTFVDFTSSLNYCLSCIRAVLNDDPRRPRYIETLSRRGYRFIAPAQQPAAAKSGLAVLPFENLNGDGEQEFVADSMADALITELGKDAALRVISRQSVLLFKNSKSSIAAIARELRVDLLVEGGILRAGDHLRVTAQLIHAEPERHLWANSYECRLDDLITVQTRIARSIAAAIHTSLIGNGGPAAPGMTQVDPKAHIAYLRGRYHITAMSEPELRKALECFRESVEHDPTYAAAHAGLANAHSLLGFWGHVPEQEAYRRAREAACNALALDDSNSLAHRVLGWVSWVYDWDLPRSDIEIERSLALNPNDESAYILRSMLRAIVHQRASDAIEDARLALDLDPLSPRTNVNAAWVPLHVGRYELAAQQARRTLKMFPDTIQPLYVLGQCALAENRFAEAAGYFDQARAISQDAITTAYAGHAKARAGRTAEARELLDTLLARAEGSYVIPRSLLWIYIGLGDRDRAFAILESQFAKRSSFLWWLRSVPLFDPLRSDPRYQLLVERMGFPNRGS